MPGFGTIRAASQSTSGGKVMKHSSRTDLLRRALAEEAARLMIEHGVEDYGLAKRKAAMRLGLSDHALLPKNAEIESALQDRQRLFGAEAHVQQVESQRSAALAAMRLLREFEPRLAGAVLTGTATAHSSVELHAFSDSPELVVMTLLDAGITHRAGERRLRPQRDESASYPTLRFSMLGHEIEVTIFPADGLRQAPSSPVDGRPMRRATTLDVELLLADSET
jgi:hypothetical protein